jgi:hypothetical protein
MLYIIFSLYAVILITFVLLYFFIVYHLANYSINASLSKIMLPFFIVISTLLLFSNIFLFFLVDWKSLIDKIPF